MEDICNRIPHCLTRVSLCDDNKLCGWNIHKGFWLRSDWMKKNPMSWLVMIFIFFKKAVGSKNVTIFPWRRLSTAQLSCHLARYSCAAICMSRKIQMNRGHWRPPIWPEYSHLWWEKLHALACLDTLILLISFFPSGAKHSWKKFISEFVGNRERDTICWRLLWSVKQLNRRAIQLCRN